MESSTQISEGVLNLPDEGFFAPNPATLGPIEWKLSARDFRGLAIRSPREIHIQQRDSLPLLLASRIGALRDWETPLADNLSLILFDHETATVSVARPFEDKDANRRDPDRPTAPPPRPTGDAATGVATSVRREDIRKLFSLDWRTRRFSLTAISFDIASNSADVSLTGGAEQIQPMARGITPPPPAVGTGLPSYDPAAVKVTPAANSVTFSVTVQPSVHSCLVRGALATAALGRHVPRTPVSVGTKRVSAVVPVTFILTGRNWPVPWTFEWGIPAFGGSDITPGTSISAAFAIPIPEEKLRIMAPGDYAAYIMMEGRLSGPQHFTMPGEPR